MASIASPSFYRQYPLETMDANIWGLRRLLDFYRGSINLEGLLFFSSSEIYGDPDPTHIPTPEDYRGNVACVGPRACYDESKRFGETLCQVFAKKNNMPITVARPFNNYGPGMRLGDKRLPADFATCILNGSDIVILSDGSPTRTFCYISDAVVGYFLCLLHGKFDSFNIGIDKPEISVRQLAEIYKTVGQALMGYEGSVKYEPSNDSEYLTDNPNRRCPVIDKARKILGYAPQVMVEEGVRRYLQFLSQQKAA
jgi:UDP-glucuronate decarboxylase